MRKYDYIRNMSIEEMATQIYIDAHNMCKYCVYREGWDCSSPLHTCVNGIKQWLESEAEE